MPFTHVSPCLMRGKSTLSHFFFCFFNLAIPSHDFNHLLVDLFFFSSILDTATVKSKDSDDLVSAEEPKVVDRVATFFEEVILIRVVAYDSFEVSIGGLLAQEGACMRKN